MIYALVFAINVNLASSMMIIQGDFPDHKTCGEFVQGIGRKLQINWPSVEALCLSEEEIAFLEPFINENNNKTLLR